MKTESQSRDLLIRVAKIHLHESRVRRQSEYTHQRDFAHQLFNWACNATRKAIAQTREPATGQMEMFA